MKTNNVHQLGSNENRKMRQSYQVNSFNHDLLPQDQPRTPQPMTPNYIFSSPTSPKIMHSPNSHNNPQYVMMSPKATPSSPSLKTIQKRRDNNHVVGPG